MKIFIADLHLGDGSKADDFHRDKELLNFFDFIDDNKHELIVLGDIFELWQCDLDKIMWNHPEVCKRLNDSFNYKLIYGNHDYIPFSKYWSEIYQTDKIFAFHGHQCDLVNRYKNPLFALKWPIGMYFTVLAGEIERWFYKDIDVWYQKMENKFGNFLMEAAKLQNMKSEYRNSLYIGNQLLFSTENTINIMGHTHQAKLSKFDGRILANCGAWVDDTEPTYIAVDDNIVDLRNGLNHKLIKSVEL